MGEFMLYKLAKNSTLLQDIFIVFSTAVHPAIKHNISKIEMMKSAFGYAAVEKIEGAYFEFGIYEGTTLKAAAMIQRTLSAGASKEVVYCALERRFYGFDSFEEGFKHASPEDAHPTFFEGNFSSSYDRCVKRFKKFPEVSLVKGYFEDSIRGKNPQDLAPGQKCAIAFIDCDLKGPALIALQYIRPILQPGSIIILDDVYAYRANPSLGVYGAWQEFLSLHPGVKVREYFNWGVSGKSYIVCDPGH